jgi:hypothetical protein
MLTFVLYEGLSTFVHLRPSTSLKATADYGGRMPYITEPPKCPSRFYSFGEFWENFLLQNYKITKFKITKLFFYQPL